MDSTPPTTQTTPQDWPLVFRAVGDGPPAEIRIRQLLKIAGRRLGLRCVGYDKSLSRLPALLTVSDAEKEKKP
jgi:hypothetical protein